jgi:predicted nucleotidyltransferase/uncharacterized protein (UPF0332 family)
MTALAEADLDPAERRAIERFVERLRDELGEQLRAVWLYGSRARGERHELSDVDLMVVVKRGGRARSREIHAWLWEAAETEPTLWDVDFSATTYDLAELAEHRRIGWFFVGAVDRDRIVVWGDPEGGESRAAAPSPEAMRERTLQYLDQALEDLRYAKLGLDAEAFRQAGAMAYTALENLARAALSEEHEFARTHKGLWLVVRETFVLPGLIDPELVSRAQAGEDLRNEAFYRAGGATEAQARDLVDVADRWLAWVRERYPGT